MYCGAPTLSVSAGALTGNPSGLPRRRIRVSIGTHPGKRDCNFPVELYGSFRFGSRRFAVQVAMARRFCCATWAGEQLHSHSNLVTFRQHVCCIDRAGLLGGKINWKQEKQPHRTNKRADEAAPSSTSQPQRKNEGRTINQPGTISSRSRAIIWSNAENISKAY
jgi:hypothetical protein